MVGQGISIQFYLIGKSKIEGFAPNKPVNMFIFNEILTSILLDGYLIGE